MNKATNLDLRISQLSPGIRISTSAEDPGKGSDAVFREHLYCQVWTLPDWPYECPAKHQLGFTNDVVMACLRHDIWWHMSPPSSAFNYSLPPLLTNPTLDNADSATQEEPCPRNSEAERLYRAIRKVIHEQENHAPTFTEEHKRHEFLNDMITTGIESGHVGAWMDVQEYDPGTDYRNNPSPAASRKAQATLKIADGYQTDDSDDNTLLSVNHELIEAALYALRNNNESNTNPYLYADIHNDAGILDAVDAVNLIEIALFGEVRYA